VTNIWSFFYSSFYLSLITDKRIGGVMASVLASNTGLVTENYSFWR